MDWRHKTPVPSHDVNEGEADQLEGRPGEWDTTKEDYEDKCLMLHKNK